MFTAGFKEDARTILSPFGYGPEFLRLNMVALEAYSSCSNHSEVSALHDGFVKAADDRQRDKQRKREEDQLTRGNDRIGGYMDDMDLPPSEQDEYYDEGEEEGEEEEVVALRDAIDREESNYLKSALS